MSRPPAAKKLRITSAHEARATSSSPTLKVIQLPSPTAGNFSPVDGIGRVTTASVCATPVHGLKAAAALAAASEPSTLRRLNDETFINALFHLFPPVHKVVQPGRSFLFPAVETEHRPQ